MKKATAIFLIILIALFSAGCSEEQLGKNAQTIKHQYVFKGENELWYAEYRINSEGRFTEKDGRLGYDSWSDKLLLVLYKHNLSDLSGIMDLEISYAAGSSGGNIRMNSLEDGPPKKFFTLHSAGNVSLINQDEIITVTITADGQSQSFELKNETSIQDKIDFSLGKSAFEKREMMEEWFKKE